MKKEEYETKMCANNEMNTTYEKCSHFIGVAIIVFDRFVPTEKATLNNDAHDETPFDRNEERQSKHTFSTVGFFAHNRSDRISTHRTKYIDGGFWCSGRKLHQ